MKYLLLLFCWFAPLALQPLRAQSNCIAPGGIVTPLYQGTFSDSVLLGRVHTKEAHCYVCVWLTGTGATEYTINADSVWIDGGSPDSMPAVEVFSQIASHAVDRGVTLGYTLCPASGSVTVGVTFAASVEPTFSGFRACGSDLNRSTFSCTSLAGRTTVLQTGCSGGVCTSGCESTCATTLLQ
jgi:hypothetical protein